MLEATEKTHEAVVKLTAIDPERVLLKAREVARKLSMAPSTVYQMIARGELEAVRRGRSVRVPVEAVADWVTKQRDSAA